MSNAVTFDFDADSIETFCKRHRISRSYLFKLVREGKGPRIRKVGRRSLITREDSATWRASLPVRGAA